MSSYPTVGAFVSATSDALRATIQAHGRGFYVQDLTIQLRGTSAGVIWDPSQRSITLVMPAMPPSARITRVEADALTGYWLHETMHCLYSDPNMMETARTKGGMRLANIMNALEDVRGERAMIADGTAAANAGPVFHALALRLWGQAIANDWTAADRSNAIFTIAILGRAIVSGYPLPDAAAMARGAPADIREILRVAFKGIRAAKCSADLLPAARKISRLMDEHDQPQPDDGQADNGAYGAVDDGAYGAAGDAEPNAGEVAKQINARAAAQGLAPQDSDGFIANMIGKGKIESWERHLHRFSDSLGNLREPDQQAIGRHKYAQGKALIANPARLRREIAELARSPDLLYRNRAQRAGRLDAARIARVPAGVREVFSSRRLEEGETALIWLCVDLSASMRSEWRYRCATSLAAHVGEAVESNGGRVAIVGFVDGATMPVPIPDTQYNCTVCSANIVMIKSEHERMRAIADRLGQYYSLANHGSPLAPSILTCTDAMMREHATRRILISLSDGECYTSGLWPGAVRGACDYAMRQGVEVAGIGIGTLSPGFPVSQLVHEPADVVTAGLRVLVDMLNRPRSR